MSNSFLAGYMYKESADPIQQPAVKKAPSIDNVYDAFSAAETGPVTPASSPDSAERFTRTRSIPSTGSSAYGPVQIGSMLGDYTPKNKAFYAGLNPEQKGYMDKLHWQQKEFLHFGKEPLKPGYQPRYDYGGQGVAGTSVQDRALYRQVTSKILQDVMRKNGGTVQGLIRAWKGNNMPQSHGTAWDQRFKTRMSALGFND